MLLPSSSVDSGDVVEVPEMIVIGTEVLAVDSLSALHRAIIRIGFPRSRGSFLALKFEEKKPFAGFTQNGQLDLVYHEDPLLRAGQAVSALGDSETSP